MSNSKILNRFKEEQLHHVLGLSSNNEILAYAKSIGVSLTMSEAAQIRGEVSDDMLESVNGGAQFGHSNRGGVYRK